MDYEGRFIMQKTVDWSLLNDGMTIPVPACAHIFYFTCSQNNDSTNIIIISPNYHPLSTKTIRISTATTKRSTAEGKVKFQFEFDNGEVLKLKLYEHLKVG